MREVYQEYDYVLDPHGAVGYRALSDYLETHTGEKGIFLETAHPVKFDSVKEIIGDYGEMPESVRELNKRKKVSIEAEPYYEVLREIVKSKL
jgi:threonine synthase